MSLIIEGTDISLTRGDSLELLVEIYNDDEQYFPESGDAVRFALKHKDLKYDRSDFKDETPLILKEIPNDTMTLVLNPEDTKGLAFDTYVYDIQITFADGFVDTFIADSKFNITKEVD